MSKKPRREEKRLKEKGKIEQRVFDMPAMLTLEKLIRDEVLASVEVLISEGKEARVFWGRAGPKAVGATELAVKIYKIETSDFTHMQKYIIGDPRVESLKKSRADIVNAWVKKEFKNLEICQRAGVPAPKPRAFARNVLVMDFIGEQSVPADLLKGIEVENPQATLDELLEDVRKLYKVGLVHGDLNEFNVMYWNGRPWLIDIGQGVLLEHPAAEELLAKDVQNVLKHFRKRYGIKRDFDQVMARIKA